MSDTPTPAPTPTPPTVQQQIAAVFQQLLAQLEVDGLTSASTVLTNYFNNIKAAPTTQNVIAQSIALLPALITLGPIVEPQAIAAVANAGLQLIALLQASVVPPVSSSAKH